MNEAKKTDQAYLRYYLDTEFYEDGRTIDLISIALVCEDGREFYAVSSEAELHRVSPWVREHVLPRLPPYGDRAWITRAQIRDAVHQFTAPADHLGNPRPEPQVWAYYADYDWVALCQLFGTMMNLPEHMPKFCMDLKQLAVTMGNPRLPKQATGEHDALEDARWNMATHAFLESLVIQGTTELTETGDGTETRADVYHRVMPGTIQPTGFDVPGALFTVRLWDGMDGCWCDLYEAKGVSAEAALDVWFARTEDGTKKISYAEIDYFRIFPTETSMAWDGGSGREMFRDDDEEGRGNEGGGGDGDPP